MNIICNVATYRKLKKISQQDLADKIGFTAKSVGEMENSKIFPRLNIANEISLILEIPINELWLGLNFEKK